MASTIEALKRWDPLPEKSEPVDEEVFANWLNTQSVKSLATKDGLMLDFKRPVEVDMILVPNELM